MSLLALPNDLLEAIAQNLTSPEDLQALIRAHSWLYDLLVSRLYTQDEKWGFIALRWAALNGRVETLQRAHRSGLSMIHDFHLLYVASEGGHVSALEFLLAEGVQGIGYATHWGVVSLLLERGGVDVNAESSDGYTPLHFAVMGGFTAAADLLLRYGADPLALAPEGKKPLFLACEQGLVKTSRLLVKHGGLDDSVRSDSGWTALHFAAEANVPELVELLLEEGASPVEQEIRGATPLHISASCGNYEISKLLIERGAKAPA
ncbi:ankyrin repeat-containing domain protein [Aspergillus spectabilis]